MIRSFYRRQDGQIRTDLKPDEFSVATQTSGDLLWVDFSDEPPSVCEPILRDTFGFHPLAIDDALQESHVPKVDDWGEYLYIVLHGITFDTRDYGDLATQELDIFLGKNYIVTYHERPISSVERVWSVCRRDERHLNKGADHLLYMLADELVASYMPVVEEIDEAIESVEDLIFNEPRPVLLEQLFAVKRALLDLRRIVTPQREVINKLARDQYEVISAEDRVFFRDVYDHLVRLHGINESLRDLVGDALEAYLSIVNNRMNEVMKTLTIITTMFMPISFLVGFFGMNFFQAVTPLEAWTSQPAFILTLAAMILIPVALYVWIRQRAWM